MRLTAIRVSLKRQKQPSAHMLLKILGLVASNDLIFIFDISVLKTHDEFPYFVGAA